MFDDLIPAARELSADDLEIGVQAKAAAGHSSSSPDAPEISATHPRVREIAEQAQHYGGVILTGPPGTSKSFFAAAAADVLTDHDRSRSRFVQFHGSYQYEDFMLGFAPTEKGFVTKEGPLLRSLRAAADDPDHLHVLVVDELSRADVGRVFGEALTYVERSKRELRFTIANGEELWVPSNFILLATMNPFDRGVDEVDAAFERRFAKIAMEPDAALLRDRLEENGVDELLRNRIVGWFRRMNSLSERNPAAAVGHAYFWDVYDEYSLRNLWDYQLQYLVQRAFRRDETTYLEMEASWLQLFDASEDPVAPAPGSDEEPSPT